MTRPFDTIATPPRDRGLGWLTGQALQMRADHPGLILRSMHTCGDYARLELFWAKALVIHSPVGATTVLQSDAANYDKQTMGYRQVARVLGDGLFTADGEPWKHSRGVIQPFFTKKTLDHYAVKMKRHADALAARLPDGVVDIADESVALTLKILGDCIFDADFEPYVPLMMDEFVAILEIVNRRVVNHVPLVSDLNLLEERRFRRSLARFDQAVQELVDKTLADPSRAETSFIHALVADARTRDPKNVRDQVITMMFAGHETTAVALQWVLYALATHPEWRARVEAEIDAGGPPDVLKRVIQETLRLYPPVWILTRRIQQDVEIDGYAIANGTMILVCPYTIHRNPRYWDQPEVFDPDRFLPERAATQQKGQYLPFGLGRRACVGAQMATLELTTILTALLRGHRFDPAPGQPPKIASSLSLRPEGGMPLRCTRRPGAAP